MYSPEYPNGLSGALTVAAVVSYLEAETNASSATTPSPLGGLALVLCWTPVVAIGVHIGWVTITNCGCDASVPVRDVILRSVFSRTRGWAVVLCLEAGRADASSITTPLHLPGLPQLRKRYFLSLSVRACRVVPKR